MRVLDTQKTLRAVQRLPFCCICGKHFKDSEKPTRQHTPPKSIFAKADRTPPLILPAHEECNNSQSVNDTVIGQLVAVLHQKIPDPKNRKLQVRMFRTPGGSMAAGVGDLPLTRIVFRWVRCFHAALYGEYLEDLGGIIYTPFPAGDLVDGELVFEPITDSRKLLTCLFKEQLRAGKTDGIICNNGKCEYRCTWLRDGGGEYGCLFALRLYQWEVLGDSRHPRMGCVGWYVSEVPDGAATATPLSIPVPNLSPLDPFAP